MLVVSDTTPIRYLVEIDLAHLLSSLFGKIAIPQAVKRELEHRHTPPKVRLWMASQPDWLSVIALADPGLPTPALGRNSGETEAFRLAAQLKAEWLLADDLAARRTARALGIRLTGTLGILLEASRRGLIDLDGALSALRLTTFRVSDELIESMRRNGRP